MDITSTISGGTQDATPAYICSVVETNTTAQGIRTSNKFVKLPCGHIASITCLEPRLDSYDREVKFDRCYKCGFRFLLRIPAPTNPFTKNHYPATLDDGLTMISPA